MTKYIVYCFGFKTKTFTNFWPAVFYANRLIRRGYKPHIDRVEVNRVRAVR